ncbi:MFS-type transporter SLC18B1-like isoform X2 [Panonychus citri]|uniref:MFS-type transporter SLC18B1-like isoform X2 n=1 Tax=Panonychus citri TaxID=50023 RepID=UPI002307468D|nr:MFS-type transporter SLC18B1-like isoform X2 [Panonychus citri]
MCGKKLQKRNLTQLIETATVITSTINISSSSTVPLDNHDSSSNWSKSVKPQLSTISQTGPIKLSRRDYLLISVFAYINIITGAAYCVLSPFFPKEAESKGLSPSTYGFLFSIQEVIAFILCPVYGKFLPKLGFRLTILTGIFVGSTGIILFGALKWAPNGTLFTTFCALIRSFGSIGLAAVSATCYAAIPVYYPNHISQVFGLIEMCYGVGMIVGPLLGGFLYEVGGFDLPFFVCGALLSLTFPVLFVLFPRKAKLTRNEKSAGIFKVLSNWRITLQILITIVLCIVFGFNQSMLEPHIRSFANLRSSAVGSIFLLSGLFYGIFTWIVGLFMSRYKDVTFMNIVGSSLIILGFILVGPIYPLPIKPSIVLVVFSQIVYGMGLAFCFVSNFTQAMREKDLSDLKDDVGAGSMISSLFVSAYALGTALGPIIGGYLVEHFDFPKACFGIVLLTIIINFSLFIPSVVDYNLHHVIP